MAPSTSWRRFSSSIHHPNALQMGSLKDRPHLVADSAFGSLMLLEYLKQWGGAATLSFASDNLVDLWEWISSDLPNGTHRIAQNTNKELMGAVRTLVPVGKSKQIYQQILTNGFRHLGSGNLVENSDLNQTSSDHPEDGMLSIPPPVTNASQEDRNSCPTNIERSSLTTDLIPLFEQDTLLTLKTKELKQTCEKYNIKKGKKKAEYVENILKRVRSVHVERTSSQNSEEQLKNSIISSESIIHNFYRSHFNLIDLLDRRWNSVEEHHAHRSWKTKFLIIILRYGVINFWTYNFIQSGEKFLNFRSRLATSLVNNFNSD